MYIYAIYINYVYVYIEIKINKYNIIYTFELCLSIKTSGELSRNSCIESNNFIKRIEILNEILQNINKIFKNDCPITSKIRVFDRYSHA